MTKSRTFFSLVALATVTTFSFAAQAQTLAEHPTTPPTPHERQAPAVEKHLKNFDNIDFDVFSNQKWDRLKESQHVGP